MVDWRLAGSLLGHWDLVWISSVEVVRLLFSGFAGKSLRFMMSWRGLLIFMSVDTSSDLISHEGQGSSGQVVGFTEASTLVTSGRLSLLKLSRVDSGWE